MLKAVGVGAGVAVPFRLPTVPPLSLFLPGLDLACAVALAVRCSCARILLSCGSPCWGLWRVNPSLQRGTWPGISPGPAALWHSGLQHAARHAARAQPRPCRPPALSPAARAFSPAARSAARGLGSAQALPPSGTQPCSMQRSTRPGLRPGLAALQHLAHTIRPQYDTWLGHQQWSGQQYNHGDSDSLGNSAQRPHPGFLRHSLAHFWCSAFHHLPPPSLPLPLYSSRSPFRYRR